MRTVAGGGSNLAGSGDGVGTSALFNNPTGVALSAARDVLWVADRDNHRIRAIDLASRVVTTLAGGGTTGVLAGPALANGVGSNALFNTPWGIGFSAFDSSLLICDTTNHAVRVVALDGSQRAEDVVGLEPFGAGAGDSVRLEHFQDHVHLGAEIVGDFLGVLARLADRTTLLGHPVRLV